MTHLFAELFTSTDLSYESARNHAEELDQWLGFEVTQIEELLLQKARMINPDGSHKTWGQQLHQGNQTWVGLSHQTLQTPYLELKRICELIQPQEGSTIIDLGAAYGRLGLVLKCFHPEVHFVGYEYVRERVDEGSRILKKFNCERSSLEEQDLTSPDFILPEAECYFLYDFGTVLHIRQILKQLEIIADRKNFKLVARGQGTRSLIQYEFPWLSQVHPPIHEEQFSIFSMSL